MLLLLSTTAAVCASAAWWIATRRARERAILPEVIEAASGRGVLILDNDGRLEAIGPRARSLCGLEGRCDRFGLESIPVQGLDARIFAATCPELEDARSLEPCILWSADGSIEVDVDVIATRPERGTLPAAVAISPVARVGFTLDADFDAALAANLDEANLDEAKLDADSFDAEASPRSPAADSSPDAINASAPSNSEAPVMPENDSSRDASFDLMSSESPLANMRFLLAEDGPDNQLLMSYILLGLGADLVLVENGEEAVARASVERYDVVLLDLYMPRMDGFTAAKAIRKLCPDVPMIAISAREDVGDACRSVGFDELLAKPLRRRELIACVQRLRAERNYAPAIESSEPGTAADSDEALFDAMMADPEFAAMVREFRASVPGRIGAMREAFANEDWKLLESLAHQLRGASGGFGMNEVSEASAALEDLLRAAYDDEAYAEALDGLERVASNC